MAILPCMFLVSCNKTGKLLSDKGWKTYVQEVAVHGEDSIYLDASLVFFTFEKSGLGCNGTVGLIGKGNCLFWVSEVKDSWGNYYTLPDGRKAKALMERFTTFNARGNWSVDGDRVKIEWISDSTSITSGSSSTSVSNDLYCRSIEKNNQASFYRTNKEKIDNLSVSLEPFFHAMFQKWLEARTALVFDEKEETWTNVKDGTPVMWQLK